LKKYKPQWPLVVNSLPRLRVHNSFTQFNPTFSNTNPQPLLGPYHPSPTPLPAPPLQGYPVPNRSKVHLTKKKCSSATYLTPATASSPPSLPCKLGRGNAPCVPPLLPHTRVNCDTSTFTSPLPFLTLSLIKHHLGWGKKREKNHPPSLQNNDYFLS